MSIYEVYVKILVREFNIIIDAISKYFLDKRWIRSPHILFIKDTS
jgi:hypothetical protein